MIGFAHLDLAQRRRGRGAVHLHEERRRDEGGSSAGIHVEERPVKRALLRFVRSLLLRCPNCGGGALFVSWFKLAPRCPHCGLWLERDEGNWLGGMAINLIVAESIPAVAVLWYWLRTLGQAQSWLLLEAGWVVGAIALPLLFFPHSRTLWLALDLTFRPVERHEVAGPPAEPTRP
jgi:uncharacterized protein (DUF983 family)